jgi:hypothetical protein
MAEPFVTLIFRGRRYGDAAMPVEALPELAAYQDLVVSAARDLWFAENPARNRLPKGFEKSLRLAMTGVTSGSSTVPQITRLPEGAGLFGSPRQIELFGAPPDVFDRARDAIEHVIGAFGKRERPARIALSKSTLARFGAFGRSLEKDDVILVAQPRAREGAKYTREVRRALVLAAQATYEEQVTVLGQLRRIDLDSHSFGLRTPDGASVPVTFLPLLADVALASLVDGAEVRVAGNGIFDAEGNLTRIAPADSVIVNAEDEREPPSACGISVADQMAKLARLENWRLDGDDAAKAHDPAQLDWARGLIVQLIEGCSLPTPFIYPTPAGEVQAEWPGTAWDVALTIDVAARAARALAVSTYDTSVEELDVVFADAGAELRLGTFMTKYSAAKA